MSSPEKASFPIYPPVDIIFDGLASEDKSVIFCTVLQIERAFLYTYGSFDYNDIRFKVGGGPGA